MNHQHKLAFIPPTIFRGPNPRPLFPHSFVFPSLFRPQTPANANYSRTSTRFARKSNHSRTSAKTGGGGVNPRYDQSFHFGNPSVGSSSNILSGAERCNRHEEKLWPALSQGRGSAFLPKLAPPRKPNMPSDYYYCTYSKNVGAPTFGGCPPHTKTHRPFDAQGEQECLCHRSRNRNHEAFYRARGISARRTYWQRVRCKGSAIFPIGFALFHKGAQAFLGIFQAI